MEDGIKMARSPVTYNLCLKLNNINITTIIIIVGDLHDNSDVAFRHPHPMLMLIMRIAIIFSFMHNQHEHRNTTRCKNSALAAVTARITDNRWKRYRDYRASSLRFSQLSSQLAA